MDELCANVKYLREYRHACLMCFSETWFESKVTDDFASLDGFVLVRRDRTNAETEKERGGGAVFACMSTKAGVTDKMYMSSVTCVRL